MPKLLFYSTSTKLPLNKVNNVLGGYTMDELCEAHNGATELNPHLNQVQELIIDSTDYPCAMLRPHGYKADEDTPLGQFPEYTIFFYKHFVETFEFMRNLFDVAKEGQRWRWSCGCIIRKYTMAEIKEICDVLWYPFIGEREPAIYNKNQVYTQRRKTGSVEEIASVLRDAKILDENGYKKAVACLNFHCKK